MFWVIKGNPAINDLRTMLVPSSTGQWTTRKPPRDWAPGDCLFFWSSSPHLCMVGLGELTRVRPKGRNGEAHFDLAYRSLPFLHPLDIDVLRRDPVVGQASFLKVGVAGTVFPLTAGEARRLAELILGANQKCLSRDESQFLRKIARTGERARQRSAAKEKPHRRSRTTGEPLVGLIVRTEPINAILDGSKTWELRGHATERRGEIALIESGTGTVVGVCEIVEAVGPMGLKELNANLDKLGGKRQKITELFYDSTFAWVITNARRLPVPVPYEHPAGAIKWVRLSRAVARRVRGR